MRKKKPKYINHPLRYNAVHVIFQVCASCNEEIEVVMCCMSHLPVCVFCNGEICIDAPSPCRVVSGTQSYGRSCGRASGMREDVFFFACTYNISGVYTFTLMYVSLCTSLVTTTYLQCVSLHV